MADIRIKGEAFPADVAGTPSRRPVFNRSSIARFGRAGRAMAVRRRVRCRRPNRRNTVRAIDCVSAVKPEWLAAAQPELVSSPGFF